MVNENRTHKTSHVRVGIDQKISMEFEVNSKNFI